MMKFLLKILKQFRNQNVENKASILFILNSLLFLAAMMFTSLVFFALYGLAMFSVGFLTNFGDNDSQTLNKLLDKIINNVEKFIKSKEKEVLPIKNLKELTEGSIIRDYSAMPEVPRLNTEGSIVRSSEEIAREKTQFISLLSILEHYKDLEASKDDNQKEEPNGHIKSIGGI